MSWFDDESFDNGESAAAAYMAANGEQTQDPNITGDMMVAGVAEGINLTQSEQVQNGSPNQLNLVSTQMQTSGPGNGAITTLSNLLGNVRGIAAQIGGAVGSIRNAGNEAKTGYQVGLNAGSRPTASNKLQYWLATASTTDKLTVGIGILGLVLLFRKA